ncbi:MAG TPA: hypothetical protein VGE12_22925 [Noviherbaspirillum sp.]
MGILGSLLGRREPVVAYRTIDGGHPAPYPDMTDEQLYNYEVAFNVPKRTFDRPPRPARPPRPEKPQREQREGATIRREPPARTATVPDEQEMQQKTAANPHAGAGLDALSDTPRPRMQPEATERKDRTVQLPPLDLGKPVRLITTKQPVEIITTRARHPVYKVHAYIGNDDVVTLFTLDGQLSENGPRYLENVPQRQHLFLNIYQNTENARHGERFLLTQHATRQDADSAARPGRIACVPLQFDL